jgi:hypothetical protein
MPLEFDGVNGIIKNTTSDGDVTIKGNDDGSEISAVTFDMSTAGKATFNNDIVLGDSQKAIFGASEDLQIFHNGSHSFVKDAGQGNLKLCGDNLSLKNADDDEAYIDCVNDGAVIIYYDNSQKFTTTSSGVTIDAGLLISGATPTVTIGDAGAEDTKIVFDGNAVDFVVGLDDSADEFRIGVGSGLGSDRVFEINSSGVSTFQKAVHFAGSVPTVTIGDGGAEDAKILFDGNAQNFHIGLDDSTDKLTIGLGNALGTYPGFTMDENTNVEFPDNSVTIISSGNNDNLTLKTTDTDADIGPNLRLYRAVTGAASDAIGTIDWAAQDAGGGLTDYASAAVTITDATDGSEDATLTLKVMNAGALNQMLTISGPETVVNEGSKDHDFRVESNGNANMFFVDGGNNHVNIGTSVDMGGTLNVNGSISLGNASGTATNSLIFYDQDDTGSETTRAFISYDSSGDRMIVKARNAEVFNLDNGKIGTGGEDTTDVSAGGLTLNQGANDTNILSFKSSDIAHGMTSNGETDTFYSLAKNSGSLGGAVQNVFSENNGAKQTGFILISAMGNGYGSNNQLRASDAGAAIDLRGAEKGSGTAYEGIGGTGNILSIRGHSVVRFLFDANGDFHAENSSTTFDEYDDAQLVRAYDLSHGKGVIDSKFDKFVAYNHEKLAELELVGREDDGTPNSFVNVTGMQRLHNGAIWQQYEKHQKLASAFYKLAEKTIGKEEADKLLTEEEIELLN